MATKAARTIAVNCGKKWTLVKLDGTQTLLVRATKVMTHPSEPAVSQRIPRFPRAYIQSGPTKDPLETPLPRYETLTASEALRAHKADGLPPKYAFEVTMYLSDPDYPSHWMTLDRWMTMGDDRPDIRWVMERYQLAKQWLEQLDADHARLRRESVTKNKPTPPIKPPSIPITEFAPDMMKLTPDHARKLKGFIERGSERKKKPKDV